jgi:hypothetical protein
METRRRHSGGITGKIRSTRFDGTNVMQSKPPSAQHVSQIVAGSETIFRRTFSDAIGNARRSRLQGANLCKRWGK